MRRPRGLPNASVLLELDLHDGLRVSLQESVAQLRQLDRAACVLCDTIRSWRCHRCSHCRRNTPTRDIIVGDIFQDRRQPGHQDAAPVGSPTARHPAQLAASATL